MQTENLTLRPHVPAHLLALRESESDYEHASGFKAAPGIREFLLMASPEFFRSLEGAKAPDPWKYGFAVLHTRDDLVIGLCGFAGPAKTDGCVEIGYSIAPAYQGRGLATETSEALVEFARAAGVSKVCAHTLAETNASTRVLEKCAFIKTDQTIDPEGKRVWRWERELTQR